MFAADFSLLPEEAQATARAVAFAIAKRTGHVGGCPEVGAVIDTGMEGLVFGSMQVTLDIYGELLGADQVCQKADVGTLHPAIA